MKKTNLQNIIEKEQSEEIKLTSYQYNQILNIQQQILDMLASNYQTSEILSELCFLAESLLPSAVASIMLKNDTGILEIKAAPSIPDVAKNSLNNLVPGPYAGSCGNAVYRNEPQYVKNTFTDTRWNDIKQLAIDFNICACWSMPIKNKHKEAIGSFALSSFEHRMPNPFHKKLLQTASTIVTIVLKNQESKKHYQLYVDMMKNSSNGMLITNEKNEIIQLNKAIENMYGYEKDELLNKNPNILSSNKYSSNFYKNMWDNLHSKLKWNGEIINKKKDGSLVTQWLSISALLDENKQVYNYLGIFTDLTELKEAQEKMEYLAFHDNLTKLYNKSYLENILNNEEKRNLILLNINNFSYINTAYGFEIADEILINIANTLSNNFEADIICRLNSDEFALLFNKEISLKEKIYEIQKFFMNNLIDINKIKLNITFSYGAVSGKINLLRKASTVLKEAKESGKNRYEIFDENNSVDYKKREEFIKNTNLIKNALDKDQIIPFFQGIHDNRTNEITKYEALVRIELEDRIISPFEFLEAAKLAGLIPEITKRVIIKTLKTMSKNNYFFSLNITEDDLAEKYLYNFLCEKIELYNISPNRVILEILEGVSSSGKTSHLSQLILLKNKGFKIAIDDFGAEYSNFERILDLDIDFLKIDAKYIKNIDTNKRSYEIVKAIAFFAKNVNIPCIAEFVHNNNVQKIINDLGIEYSQGYYFSEPKKELLTSL